MRIEIKPLFSIAWTACALAPLTACADDVAVPVTATDQVLVEYFQPAVCNGLVFFAGEDRDRGSEPWVSDGTQAGTRRLKDIFPGPKSSNPFEFAAIRDRAIFWATDPVNGTGLWVSDGSEAGTTLLKVFSRGASGSGRIFRGRTSELGNTAVFEHCLYFLAKENGGVALFKTDGTPAGTVKVLEGVCLTAELHAAEDGVFVFAGRNGQGLWKTDGTPLNVFGIASGSTFVENVRKWPREVPEGTAYPGRELAWRPVSIGGTVFFAGRSTETGVELWKSDGTEAGTSIVRNIRKGFGPGYGERDRSSYPHWLTVFNNEVYFVATDDVDTDRGRELWKTDGTEAGTVMVKDINPGRSSSDSASLIVWNNALYFTARNDPDNQDRFAIWRSDGTERGTVAIGRVSYVPKPPDYRSPPMWPMAWPTTFRGCLFAAVNPYSATLGVARMQPGARVMTMVFATPRAQTYSNEYSNPLWVECDEALYFVAGRRLWRYRMPDPRRPQATWAPR